MFSLVLISAVLLSSIVELVSAIAFGWSLPLLQICAFHFCMRRGFWHAILPLILGAACLDAAWMHRFPSQVLAVFLVALLTASWRRYGDLTSWSSLILAAFGIAFLSWGAILCGAMVGRGAAAPAFLRLPGQLLASFLLLPPVTALLNSVLARRLNWLATSFEPPSDDEEEDAP